MIRAARATLLRETSHHGREAEVPLAIVLAQVSSCGWFKPQPYTEDDDYELTTMEESDRFKIWSDADDVTTLHVKHCDHRTLGISFLRALREIL